MRVYSRVSDKILYITLIIITTIFFLFSCFLFIWQYSIATEYWELAGMCKITKDFDCLWNIRNNQQISKDIGWSLIATLLIIYGLVLSIAMQTLFRGFKLGKNSD